ncbi:MAG: TIGR04222 domain-containing membrane protein, partial [Alphaproteobacteria bacterium]|nr:TIGR04222 domain-containing membrane protein [Alphaproteobacteria bacterium]
MQNIPLLNLPGPEFLNFFGLVVIIVLAAAYLCIRLADRTDRRPPPPVPQNPDAMEVAFLQGGVNQVIRTLIYDLAQRG